MASEALWRSEALRARIRAAAPVCALVALSYAFRWPALLNADSTNSDAAIVGLQAMHLLRGEWSPFLWGSGYQTSVDSAVAAGFFAVLGPTPRALMLSALTLHVASPVAHPDRIKELQRQCKEDRAKVGDEREKYMCFGPYATEVGEGPRVATWNVMFDNVTFDNYGVLTLDVADARTGRVLASQDVRRGDLAKPMVYEPVSLRFYSPYGSRLEFRTLWHGASYARVRDVEVTRG